MATIKYNPFIEADQFPTGLRLFQDTVNRLLSETGNARPWSPAVDIVETENELVLKADVPGLALEQIDIRMENGTLTVKGERKFQDEAHQSGYHRIERSYGAFARSFALPETVDPEKVTASYTNGVLTVTLPKKEVAKPRTIKVAVQQ